MSISMSSPKMYKYFVLLVLMQVCSANARRWRLQTKSSQSVIRQDRSPHYNYRNYPNTFPGHPFQQPYPHPFPNPNDLLSPAHRLPRDVMVDVINNMALRLLEIHNEHNDNNIAISPYGAISVLVVLLEGLTGEAAFEIINCVPLPPDISIIRIGLRDIHRHLKSYFIPKEGFLSGLTLSHDNITLSHEYQAVLKFYGYDVDSFNNPNYPDMLTTPTTTTTIKTTTTTIKTTTMENDIPSTKGPPAPSTLPSVETKSFDSTTAQDASTVIQKESTTSEISKITEVTEMTLSGRAGEEPLDGTTTPRFLTEKGVEGSTLKQFTSTIYNSEIVPVTDVTTEMVLMKSSDGDEEGGDESRTSEVTNDGSQTITQSINFDKSTLKSTSTEQDDSQSDVELSTENKTFKPSTNRFATDKDATEPTSFDTTSPVSNIPEGTTGSIMKMDTTKPPILEETESLLTTGINTEASPNMSFTTMQSIATDAEGFSTLTEGENEIAKEFSEKLIEIDDGTTAMWSRTPSDVEGPYTQTQMTEATSLEDMVLLQATNSTQFNVNARLKLPPMKQQERGRRSVLDYFIARYYDDFYISSNHRRYLPVVPDRAHKPYQPNEPYTFLVNGKYRETNISFMTYDTILPFTFLHALDAMALRFPLDSNMYYLLLVLPVHEQGIDKLISNMQRTGWDLRSIVDQLEYTHVKAVIPSFSLKGYVVLTPTIQKLGIHNIFEPRHADFTPMTTQGNIYVTNIEQAVTVTIRNYVDPPGHSADFTNFNHNQAIECRVDHPFLYFVMDSQVHVNLMAGKILNPLNTRIR